MVELSEKGRTYALFAISVCACSLGALSQTAVNSMLAGIGADFGIGSSVAQWLTTIYMLVLGITVPVVTFLSRKFAIRTIILVALGLCAAGAALACAAPGFASLMAGRVLQAMSTGITMPILQTIAMTRFPADQRATAMGIGGIGMGFAPNIGPTIGGALVDSWGWRSFFLILFALCMLLIAVTLVLVRRHPAPSGEGAVLDIASLALSTLGFGGLLLAFSNASNFALTSAFVWLPLVMGALCVVAFVLWQKRIDHPLVDMGIFASRQYGIGFAASCCLFGSFMGITLIVPLYVMNLCGGTALDSGLIFLPAMFAALVFNPLAGFLCDKIGIRRVVVCSSVFLAVGSVSMAFIDEGTPLTLVAALQFVRAVGVSSLIGPFASWSLADLPGPLVVDGSAFSTMVRQVCASLGTAIMVLVITLVGTMAAPAALPYQLAFGVSAALSVATAAIGIAKVR